MSVPQAARRDGRIDLLRGGALLLVCSDHIAASSARFFTPLGRCFFDLTEVFLFLSGCACGVAYSRRRLRRRWRGEFPFRLPIVAD